MAHHHDVGQDREAGEVGARQIVAMHPVPAHALDAQPLLHLRLQILAHALHLPRDFDRKASRHERVVAQIILERSRMEAGDVPVEGAGEVERSLHPALEAGVVIDMEENGFHLPGLSSGYLSRG